MSSYRYRTNRSLEVLTVLFGVIFSIPLIYLFALVFSIPAAWVIMLILGAFHASFAAVPALGFWLTLIGTFAVRLLVASNVAQDSSG